MQILRKSRETLEKKDLYFMLTDKSIKKMSETAGKEIKVEDYVLYEDIRRDTGEWQKMISIKTPDGVYASNSGSFIECFENIIACFGTDFSVIKVFKEKSNKGREYLNCSYVS